MLETNTPSAGDKHFWCLRQMRFTLETNTLGIKMNTLEMSIGTSATRTLLATNDLQTDLSSRWLLLTDTNIQKWEASHTYTHLQARYAHALYVNEVTRILVPVLKLQNLRCWLHHVGMLTIIELKAMLALRSLGLWIRDLWVYGLGSSYSVCMF